jgi:chromosome segregation ATPase
MSDDATTKPTLETILETVNVVGEKVTALTDGMNSRFERIESEISQMRQDINTGFRKVERKIELLNRDFLAMRGDHEDLLQRVEDLESKAS